MPCSPAQLAANKANASRSTGPRSEAGRNVSRLNTLKLGMIGDCVVLTSRDAAEVEALSAELVVDLRPSNAASRVLLRRFAVMSVRLDRCVEHGDAMAAERVRDAGRAFDTERIEQVEVIGTQLEHEPAATLRTLQETAEGIEWLIKTWLAIKADLGRGRKVPWQRWHLDRIENLLGRYPGESPPTRFEAPACACWGDFAGRPSRGRSHAASKRRWPAGRSPP